MHIFRIYIMRVHESLIFSVSFVIISYAYVYLLLSRIILVTVCLFLVTVFLFFSIFVHNLGTRLIFNSS